MYSPLAPAVFMAAYSGALAGMGVNVAVLGSPNSNDYTTEANQAGLFAEALDTAWGGIRSVSDLDQKAIQESCQNAWIGRNVSKTTVDSSGYVSEATAIIGLITAAENFFTAQGISPNLPVGSAITQLHGDVVAVGPGNAAATVTGIRGVSVPIPPGIGTTVLTDTAGVLSWAAGGGGGITQLTGDGTAGPGAGAQALTINKVSGNTAGVVPFTSPIAQGTAPFASVGLIRWSTSGVTTGIFARNSTNTGDLQLFGYVNNQLSIGADGSPSTTLIDGGFVNIAGSFATTLNLGQSALNSTSVLDAPAVAGTVGIAAITDNLNLGGTGPSGTTKIQVSRLVNFLEQPLVTARNHANTANYSLFSADVNNNLTFGGSAGGLGAGTVALVGTAGNNASPGTAGNTASVIGGKGGNGVAGNDNGGAGGNGILQGGDGGLAVGVGNDGAGGHAIMQGGNGAFSGGGDTPGLPGHLQGFVFDIGLVKRQAFDVFVPVGNTIQWTLGDGTMVTSFVPTLNFTLKPAVPTPVATGGATVTISAGNGHTTGVGAQLLLESGNSGQAGTRGGSVQLIAGTDVGQQDVMVEVLGLSTTRRVVALAQTGPPTGVPGLASANAPDGDGVVFIWKAQVSPTLATVNGGSIFVDHTTGNLMFIGTSGTARLVALA